jgi:probable phosphoglycerate mutase
MQKRTVLTLVRHGETRANLDGVWHGSTDTELTERGLAQAQRVADHLASLQADASALYASELQRARHTAEAIGEVLGLPVLVDPDLGEYRLGEWEGKSFRELHHDHRLWEQMKTDPDFAPHGGESPRQVTERFSGALQRIAEAHRGERVIIVTHGGALSMGLAHILDGSYTEWGRVMSNCAVSELVPEPPPELLSFNHTSHLEGL